MIITLKNEDFALPVDCETYSITPKYTNIWVLCFEQVSEIAQHRICDNICITIMNCGCSWRVGFKTNEVSLVQ